MCFAWFIPLIPATMSYKRFRNMQAINYLRHCGKGTLPNGIWLPTAEGPLAVKPVVLVSFLYNTTKANVPTCEHLGISKYVFFI